MGFKKIRTEIELSPSATDDGKRRASVSIWPDSGWPVIIGLPSLEQAWGVGPDKTWMLRITQEDAEELGHLLLAYARIAESDTEIIEST